MVWGPISYKVKIIFVGTDGEVVSEYFTHVLRNRSILTAMVLVRTGDTKKIMLQSTRLRIQNRF